MTNNESILVRVPAQSHLDHEAVLTGHEQRTSSGKLYVEAQRVDNGLFEMVAESWIECDDEGDIHYGIPYGNEW